MKLRIVKDLLETKHDWYRLEEQTTSVSNYQTYHDWHYITGSMHIAELEKVAAALLEAGSKFRVIKEYDSSPEACIDPAH